MLSNDRMNHPIIPEPRSLAIGLGANIPSKIGNPIETLITLRKQIEEIIEQWVNEILFNENLIEHAHLNLRFRWSPLFESRPIKGSPKQPNFINAVLIIDGERIYSVTPTENKISILFSKFQNLEKIYGRKNKSKSVRWGSRPIDIDLLAWGDLQINNTTLTLPHKRLIERDFVILPLAFALTECSDSPPKRLPPQNGWKE